MNVIGFSLYVINRYCTDMTSTVICIKQHVQTTIAKKSN